MNEINIQNEINTRISAILSKSFDISKTQRYVDFLGSEFVIPNMLNITMNIFNKKFTTYADYQEYMSLEKINISELLEIFQEEISSLRIQSVASVSDIFFDNEHVKDSIKFNDNKLEMHNFHEHKRIMKEFFVFHSGWCYKINEEDGRGNLINYYRHATFLNHEFFRSAYSGKVELFKDELYKKSLCESLNKFSNLDLKESDITEDSISKIGDNLKMLFY